jgi:hypothetical protein
MVYIIIYFIKNLINLRNEAFYEDGGQLQKRQVSIQVNQMFELNIFRN